MTDALSRDGRDRKKSMLWRLFSPRISKWKQFAVLCGLLFVLETLSLGFTFTWYHFREVNAYPFLDKFLLTRYLVSPLLFDNPARKLKGIEYLGPRDRQRSEAQWFVSDAMFGWRQAMGVSILKQPNRVADQVGWKMTNAQGFPVSGSYDYFYEKSKPNKVFRIIVIGASHVEGDGAETPLDNLPSSLFFSLDKAKSALLPDGYDRFEVINAGVGAFSSSQTILYLLRDLVSYEPDLVIAYGGAVDMITGRINFDQTGVLDAGFDYRNRIQNSVRLDQSHTFSGSLRLLGDNLVNQVRMIIDEFAITFVLSKGWEKLTGIIGPVAKVGESKTATKSDDQAYLAAALTTYSRNIRLLASIAEIYGFRIAFVLEPVMPTSGKQLTLFEEEVSAGLSKREARSRVAFFEKARGLYDMFTGHYRDKSKVCFFDISKSFSGVTERVFEDSTHLLGAGNRILATRIRDALGRCGIIQPLAK